MKFRIMHESRGRVRVQMVPRGMTLEQADILEQYLLGLSNVERAFVHERTGCAIVYYKGARGLLLEQISRFSYASAPIPQVHSSRELNRCFQEKLVGMVVCKAFRSVFFPAPLRTVYAIVKSIPYLFRGVRCLLRRQCQVELLDALSILVSMLQRDFDTASSVMFLLSLGDLLESWTRKKSAEDLARCMSLNVDRVWLKTGENETLVPLAQIQSGDQVVVRMGGMIPLDGVVTQGEVMVNQASLTGEPLPVAKVPGGVVYAGTVVEEGECVFRVERQPGEGRYDKIVAMIEQSEKMKSSVEHRASYLADRLVPYTLAASGVTYLLSRDLTRASSVLMVDFSCALKLAMPLAVLSAMREAGTCHATVKGGKFLELTAQADTIVFDKTGTQTHACPVVADVVPFGGRDEAEMLRLAACLEEHFPHSMANAVVQAAKARGLSHEEMHTQVEYIVAHGISSTVGAKKVVIGSAHFVFDDEGCTVPPEEQERFAALPAEYSHLYLAVGGVLAAVICISDPLRREARTVMERLRTLGVEHIVMLTGDSERTAVAIAAQVGVDEYWAEVLPEDKAHFIENLRAQGHTVIMVGDGMNDSPALSAADVGIAISDGAAIAREIADITISADNLYQLIALRELAQALMGRIRSNYRLVVSINSTLMALGALGVLQPAATALMHNLSTLALSLRSMTNLLPGENENGAES